MAACSLHRKLEIVPGELKDYEGLAAYHYRDGHPGAVHSVFVLKPKRTMASFGTRPAGVIVYAMPHPRMELRTVATEGMFANLDRQTELALINRNIRCIARVIIEPRFRGIGLATRLVRDTMPRMNVPIVEALAVMPRVNPFLEHAGMKASAPRVPVAHVELIEAFSAVGIEADRLIDPHNVQDHIEALDPLRTKFIETRIQRFLKSHGTRRTMPANLERTRYVLGRLTHRPAYYIWHNPHLEVSIP
jgi:hypothetical protein